MTRQLTEPHPKTWQWSKRYRVWDAARKVFVFPENWLEPDQVLSAASLVALRRVAAAVRARCAPRTQRVRNRTSARCQGVPVLFTGRNRVAALVAAQTLARDLEKNLYRVDVSQVVGKYIGETEKNLSRVFDSTEKGGSVLFFDEADALLRKRTDVKDSHDRYADIEIKYLLERIEGFGSPAILSTNNLRGLDDAFLRRFRFVIRVVPPRKGHGRGPGPRFDLPRAF
jgi:hypothetical protein